MDDGLRPGDAGGYPGIVVTGPASNPLIILFRLRLHMPERREFGKLLDLVLDHLAFAIEKRGDGAAEAGIGDPVRAVSRGRQIAALQFVRSLRPGLDPLQPALDREFD